MEVLTTRKLSYTDDNGNPKDVLLTIFKPYELEKYDWRSGFIFGPPIERPEGKITASAGVDFLQAFLGSLGIARGHFEGTELRDRLHWQGRYDCGLPWPVERPASHVNEEIPPPAEREGDMTVLAIRETGFRDENDVEHPFLLTVFTPFETQSGVWKCGFTFDPLPNATICYGVGDDFIEAVLDCLVKARVTYEGMMPKGWKLPGESFSCECFPYKIGRSFYNDPTNFVWDNFDDPEGDAQLKSIRGT